MRETVPTSLPSDLCRVKVEPDEGIDLLRCEGAGVGFVDSKTLE